MTLKRSVIIGIVLAILLTIVAGLVIYFVFFFGSHLKLELSNYDEDRDNVFSIDRSDSLKITKATRNIRSFLEPYKNDSNPDVYNNCNFFNPPPANKTCGIDLNQFNPCVNLYGYGLRQGSPCIFLKLKADADFKPQFLNVSNLPEAMPVDLKTDIQYYIRNNPVYSQIMWVSCEGKSDDDKANLGPVTYIPRRGFPGFFYPCQNERLCTHPILALRFERPKLGVQINVRCKVWAENVDESIDLQLQVD